MEEKRYLKWYNKVGYGSGDVAGNVVYAFLSTFVMLYLTNTVGLNPGIVGTLIAVSKLFDGVTDIFFGSMIDKTKTKMGKAKPWMLYGYIGCAVTLIGVFEYGEAYIQSQDPYVDFLKIIRKHLKPDGKIVIAIENRFGLKYWAGCTEDHFGTLFEGIQGYPSTKGVKTFTVKELKKITF